MKLSLNLLVLHSNLENLAACLFEGMLFPLEESEEETVCAKDPELQLDLSWTDVHVIFIRPGVSNISGLLKTVIMWIVTDVIYCSVIHRLDCKAVGGEVID